jgi:hypothetical protein
MWLWQLLPVGSGRAAAMSRGLLWPLHNRVQHAHMRRFRREWVLLDSRGVCGRSLHRDSVPAGVLLWAGNRRGPPLRGWLLWKRERRHGVDVLGCL